MKYQLGDAEAKFADIIWKNEPIPSGELVKRCETEMAWKKSTVYTVLRKLCLRGIFVNRNSIVTSNISREEFMRLRSREFVADTFHGSLPGFLTAFMGGQTLGKEQAEELRKLIEQYEEE